jgi:hypothetical protein
MDGGTLQRRGPSESPVPPGMLNLLTHATAVLPPKGAKCNIS